jgi:hypothetical protein
MAPSKSPPSMGVAVPLSVLPPRKMKKTKKMSEMNEIQKQINKIITRLCCAITVALSTLTTQTGTLTDQNPNNTNFPNHYRFDVTSHYHLRRFTIPVTLPEVSAKMRRSSDGSASSGKSDDQSVIENGKL